MTPSDAQSTSVDIGGLRLKNPVICASGEHVMTAGGIRAALASGAAAVVAKSVNERPEARDQLHRTDYVLLDADWHALPWEGSPPRDAHLFCRSGLADTSFEDWLSTVAALDAEAKAQDAHVAASLILADRAPALAMAKRIEQAGIRILEFNIGAPYGDEAKTGAIVTERAAARVRDHVAAMRDAVSIPLWVKITGQSDDVAGLAQAAKDGGADAVVLMGRSLGFLPDLDTMAPLLNTNAGLGGAWALPLTCYWLARSRNRLGPDYPLIATNGARSGLDVARFLLAGATATELCTAVMTGGFGVLTQAIAELDSYARQHQTDLRDIIGHAADRLQRFDAQPRRPDIWRRFVPAETIG